MSNDTELARLWKLQTQVNRLIMDGKRSPQRLLDVLQAILVAPEVRFELFLPAVTHITRFQGFRLRDLLKERGLYGRCCSLEDPEIRTWLRNPLSYPAEYKGKEVCLWKSEHVSSQFPRRAVVPALVWSSGRVVSYDIPLETYWTEDRPVLLRVTTP